MATETWDNFGSRNNLLPDSTMPLPEPMLTSHMCRTILQRVSKLLYCVMGLRITLLTFPGGQWINALTFQPFSCNHTQQLFEITKTQDIFSLAAVAWKHPKYPCFYILPLEFEVNIDIYKHENSEVIYSNRNKSPNGMSGNSRLQKHGRHVNSFHLTKCIG